MKKTKLRQIIRESIKEVIAEQAPTNPCNGPNPGICWNMIQSGTNAPNSGWISNMEALAASPGGCGKIVMKESEIDSKMNSKSGTENCLDNAGNDVHRICNGSNPKWVAQLKGKLDWLGQSSSPFMLCAGGTCNDNTNDCD